MMVDEVKTKKRKLAAEHKEGDERKEGDDRKEVEFVGSHRWQTGWRRMQNLSTRRKTGTHGKTPANAVELAMSFRRTVIRLRQKRNYPLSRILNTDHTPICIDGSRNMTLDTTGVQEVLIAGTNHEKSIFTVQLTCASDCTKFPPCVIFKLKRIPNVVTRFKIVVAATPKGLSNTGITKDFLRRVIRRHLWGGPHLLTWDAFKGQDNDEMRKNLKHNACANLDVADIPGCMTKHLQPIDLTVNKHFKAYYDEEYDEWYLNGPKFFTPKGYHQKPSFQQICDFIVRAWEKIKPETIRQGFLQAGISISLDGDEDDLVKFI